MDNLIAKKLRIKSGFKLKLINAPQDFEEALAPLPEGAIITEGEDYNQVHWFVKNKIQLENELGAVLQMLSPPIICWIYFPKGSSNMQTDLTRDRGWDAVTSNSNMKFITLISFNNTWSAFGFKLLNDVVNQENLPKVREISKYINMETKEILVPEDLDEALQKNPSESAFFRSLSFTNKKEFVEWIVTAKKAVTRQQRISATIEKLSKNWKNPYNN